MLREIITGNWKLAFATLTLSSLLCACQSTPISKPEWLDSKIAAIVNKVKVDEPGMALLVRHRDQVINQSYRGLANNALQRAITASTGFRLGSISKPFTAIAIMQLVERGKLSLDESIVTYLPSLGNKWHEVTVRHLLSHRVYISEDFFSDANLAKADKSINADLFAFLAANNIQVKAQDVDKAMYCNSCYVLLADVVSAVSGESFANYMQQHVFDPAGMEDSYIVDKGVKLKPLDALNYASSTTFFGIEQYTTGAMAQVSSLNDLNAFIVALKRGKLVRQETLARMTRVHADLGDDGLYGLGWIIGYGDEPFFSHGGSQDGYQSELFFYPKYGLEIVSLTNGGETTYELTQELIRTVVMHYKYVEKPAK